MEDLSSHQKSYYKAIIIKKDTELGLHLCKIQSGKTKLHTNTDALKCKGIITPKSRSVYLKEAHTGNFKRIGVSFIWGIHMYLFYF